MAVCAEGPKLLKNGARAGPDISEMERGLKVNICYFEFLMMPYSSTQKIAQ